MAFSREELLLLLLYTSPHKVQGNPAVFGSTRAQKLVFLATREFEVIQTVTSTEYGFIPYDFGPYSKDLERDLRPLLEAGVIDNNAAAVLDKEPEQLSYAELTSFMKKRPRHADPYVLRGPLVPKVQELLMRLKAEGVDIQKLLEDFRTLHFRYGTMDLEELLRYVYERYPETNVNTKLRHLLPGAKGNSWDQEEDDDDQ